MIAGAMPPAAHMVTRPRFRPRRSSSSMTVPIKIEPVAPIGWPRAIAPPLTLTFSRSSFRSRMNFSATTEKASLISQRSMSSTVRPALASTLRLAGTGGLKGMFFGVVRGGQEHRPGAGHDARRVAGVVDVLDLQVRIDQVDQPA